MDWTRVAIGKTRRQIWSWMILEAIVVFLFGLTVFANSPDRSAMTLIVWLLLAATLLMPIAVLRRFFHHVGDDSSASLDLAWRIAFLGYAPICIGLILVQFCVLHAH